MLIAIAIVNLAILCIVLANARYWPGLVLDAPAGASVSSVSVLIPARNEERNIEAAVRSALAQEPFVREVLVYDDHSEDGTARIVAALAARFPAVSLVPAEPLPDGWLGKPFACSRLAARAAGQWLLFLDADTRLHPGAASKMLGEAAARRLTFLSCWPGILAESFWERVFMPMLNFSVFSLFPAPLQERCNDPAFGLAHGACLFIRHAEYRQVGGHALVQGELFEDTVLAREWRRHGLRGACLNGRRHVSVRMYRSLREMAAGFAKIAYPAFRRESSFWLFLLLHGGCLGLPVLAAPLAWWLPGPTAISLCLAAGAVLLARAVQCVQFGYPLWSALLHPVAEAGLVGLGLHARHNCRSNKGVQWKGRTCTPPRRA